MSNFKKFMAMLLVICMLTSALPMTAWAAETDGTEATEAPEETQETTGEDIPTLLADTLPTPGHMAAKPQDGTTKGEPFPQGTGGSNSFRIPALVTLSDGTLVAAADARWNTTYDGGGLDTIVARSSDNGANWSYTFANYLGDNGNVYNGSSTCFIDPSLAVTANDTIYMLVDLYPYGVALNGSKETTPVTAKGFNVDGKLLLSGDNHNSYGYYLDGNIIYDANGTAQTGYYVDAYFNLYTVDANGEKTYKSNLFFKDSPFTVVRTGYLYLTKSTDKGETWSAPTLLNLKTSSEQVCLVGPGRGLVTKDGTIIFPVYSYAGESAKYTALIYSTDNGVNWQRSANLSTTGTHIPNTTSEAAMVELGNGKIRTFFRNDNATLCYSDFDLTNGTWGTCVNTGVACNSDTEMSAIVYSKKVEHNGKQKSMVLVSCPAGPNAAGTADNNGAYRSSGKIFAGLIDPDTYEMTWLDKSVAVTPVATGAFTGGTYTAAQGFFGYSCLTEQKDNGSVSILYEDSQQGWGYGDGYGYTMDYKTYTESELETAFGVTFAEETSGGEDTGDDEDVTDLITVNVTLKVGETKEYAYTNGYSGTAAENIQPNTAVATMNVTDNRELITVTGTGAFAAGKSFLLLNQRAGALLTDTPLNYAAWGANMGLEVSGAANLDSTELWSISPVDGGYALMRDNKFLTIVPGNTTMETTAQALTFSYQDGGYWLIYANCLDGTTYKDFYLSDVGGDSWNGALSYHHTGTDAGDNWIIYEVPAPGSDSTVTFEGVAPGKTVAVVGNTQYNITVLSEERTVDIELEVGETFTYTDTTGVYTEDSDIKQRPDEAHATMDVRSAAVPVTALESGKQYLIVNRKTGDVLTDTVIAVSGAWDAKTGLDTTGKLSNDSTELWTITKTDAGYTVVQDGKYLTVAGYYANMSGTATNLTLTHTANGWTILDSETTTNVANVGTGSYYLSDNVGDGYSGGALGRSDTNNEYVYWDIYELSAATDVTFTGVAPGTTTAKVGNTTYNITVVEQETDDEVENTATDIWTVDPEIQAQRIADATTQNTGYTDETWEAYEEALNAANDKLAEITDAVYTSPEEAQTAIDELQTLVDALEEAKAALVPGKTITIRYWRLGQKIREETRSVPAVSATYTLEPTLKYNEETYAVSPTVLNITGNATEFDVQLLSAYDASSGIIGSDNLTSGSLTTEIKGRPVNEMTVTVGIEYKLGLADILADGQTIEWSSDNTAVATVDADGKVTAVAEGTANITAKIKNGDKVISTYTVPITVLPAAGDVNKRTVAMYVDNIDNTTVTCVLHANNKKWEFDVVEGELIYGQFQMTGPTSPSTDADSVTGLTFFGNPDEGHALVYMSSTQSAQEYFPLHKGGQVVQNSETLEPWPSTVGNYYANKNTGAAKWLAIGLSGNNGNSTSDITSDVWKEIVAMAQSYADEGYDGAMGFTRRMSEGDNYTNLSFTSDPLPKIDKAVDGVLPVGGKFDNYQRYVENMVAAVDETVFFKITITLDRPLKWEPARDTNGNILKDTAGNVIAATDEYGKLSAITFNTATLLDDALEFKPDDGDLEAYFYTKELDRADGTWDGVVSQEYQVNYQDLKEALNKGWADDETQRKLEFYLVYKIVEEDIPRFNIENVANLSYSYHSEYSTGTTSAEAPAKANITVIGQAMDNVVIDFGHTIVYTDLTNRHLKGVYVDGENDNTSIIQCKATAKYGTVTVTREQMKDENGNLLYEGEGDKKYPQYEYTVTYTPTCILQGPDMVLLYGVGEKGQEKVINGFIVYPATTVYYEEGFAFPALTNPGTKGEWDSIKGDWTMHSSLTAPVTQTFEKLGRTEISNNVYTIHSDKQYAYGFDPIYNSSSALNDTYAESRKIGDRTRFTFTGDGIQIFANCSPACTDAECDHKDCAPASGYVAVEIREATAPYKIVRLAMVDTKVLSGSTDATTGQDGEMYGLPVVSLINIQGMNYGQYIVTISKVMDNKPVYIDGIRIFNTVEPNPDSSPFTIDYEDQPEFYELRDAVLSGFGVSEATSQDYKKLAEQIYNKTNGLDDPDGTLNAYALIFDKKVDYARSDTVQDLLDKGPKNELFLYPNQTLSFKVETDRVMQVGMKAPQGATTATVTVNDTEKEITIASSVDMFHYLIDRPAGTKTTYTVSIQNTGDKLLSITLLKICDDPKAAFMQLTQEDIENIILKNVEPITIVSQPADTAVKMGERYNVEVIAQGENLKYQWYFRNAGESVFHKSGVKDNTYDDVMTAARAGREVYCVITDAEGNSVTTETARIDVIPETKLELLQQPVDQSVKMGERYNVEVIAQGEGLKYRWFFRNKGSERFSASGIKDNTYDDVMTAARAGREVYCVITDAYGNKVTTNTVTLNVLPNAALEIVQQPVNGEAKLGEIFLVEVIAKGDGLRYQWYYRNAGSEKFVKSGVRDNTYDDVMTAARAGREVYCVITDAYGNSVTTDTVKLISVPGETLEIVQQPVDAEAKLGEKYLVEVLAKGEGLRYQWYYRNAGSTKFVVSGVKDNTYDDVMTAARAGREVYCVITDAHGNKVTTDTVKLMILPSETLEIVQQPVNGEAKLGEMYLVEVVAKGDGLRYQWYFRNAGETVFHKSGVTDNTYDDVMTAARAGREVYCVITDAFGNSVATETVKLICIREDAQMVTDN